MADLIARLQSALADRYIVEREIGRGGMATVFLARELRHQRYVALKVLHEELGSVLGAERFVREIQITARFAHPHILTLLDSGEADGLLWYSMPFLEGASLRDRMRTERHIALEEVVRITKEIAAALEYSHERRVIHRDIKPENILFASGHVVVSDFGVAHAVGVLSGDRITQSGIVVGTPAYMSPEQATGESSLTPASDVYALACVAYEMLAGDPPFTAASSQAIIARHITDPVPSLRTVRQTVTPAAEAVVVRGLAKLAVDRYRSANEFAEALEHALLPALSQPGRISFPGTTSESTTGRSTGADSESASAPSRATTVAAAPANKRGWLLAVAGVAVLAAAAVATWWGGKAPAVAKEAAERPMIAVLPFELSGSAADSAFAEGMTEEITAQLARIPGLGVISRMSAMQFDPRRTSARAIAESLKVQYLLVGSIRIERDARGGGRVRVLPHLINAEDEREIWQQEALDASLEPGQIIGTQVALAYRVAEQLDLQLTRTDAESAPPTRSTEAYELYLRAMAQAARPFSEPSIRTAISLLEGAVGIDSTFALAYARLAEANGQYFALFERSPKRLARARDAMERAIRIDSLLPAAQLARGYLRLWGLQDFQGALAEFQKALQREPSNSQLIYTVASVLRRTGQWDEAVRRYEEALRLNPRTQAFSLELGSTLMVMRRFDEAKRYLDRAAELAPDWTIPYMMRAHLYLSWTGDTARVRAELDEGVRRAGLQPMLSTLAGNFRYVLSLASPAVRDSLASTSLATLRVDSTAYYTAKGQWHFARGRTELGRAYFDSVVNVASGRARIPPIEPFARIDLATANGFLGRDAETRASVERALQLIPLTRDHYLGPPLHGALSDALVQAKAYDGAIDILETLMKVPSSITPAMLRNDPHFDALRSHPRFRALLQ